MQTKFNKLYAVLGASIAMLGLTHGASAGQSTFVTVGPEATIGLMCTAESECGKAKTNIEKRKSVLRGHVNRGSGYNYGQARSPSSQVGNELTMDLPVGVDLIPRIQTTAINAGDQNVLLNNTGSFTAPGFESGTGLGGTSGVITNSLVNPAQGILDQ